jgi:Divergent InlB B-repeat domain
LLFAPALANFGAFRRCVRVSLDRSVSGVFMNAKWFSIFALIAAATFFFSLSSCGFNQHLVSIQIAPTNFTFGGMFNPPLYVDFAATGTYEHPPKTIDVTNIVTWGTDSPQIVQISSAGVATTNTACGTASISASFYDSPNLVSSNPATVVVDGPASLGCTPAGPQPILTVDFAGTGGGTVTGGISCSSPSTCSDQFTTGATVMLTASNNNMSVFAGWSGCTSTSPDGTVCTVLLEINTTVTATFNLN